MLSFITIVSASDRELARWLDAERAGHCTVVSDIDLLEATLHSPVIQAAGEIARVIIDGGMSLERFLQLTTGLPETFRGELLYIREDGSGYVSTRELQTLRTVKTLAPPEVAVYLMWHGLPAKRQPLHVGHAGPKPSKRPEKHR